MGSSIYSTVHGECDSKLLSCHYYCCKHSAISCTWYVSALHDPKSKAARDGETENGVSLLMYFTRNNGHKINNSSCIVLLMGPDSLCSMHQCSRVEVIHCWYVRAYSSHTISIPTTRCTLEWFMWLQNWECTSLTCFWQHALCVPHVLVSF